ncbi:putative transcription elongation factor SPT5 homolog 1, partial [Tanacetum coccineum]
MYVCQGNPLASRVAQLRTPSRFPNSPGRSPARGVPPLSGGRHRGGGRGRDSLAGSSIKIRLGPWKGYKGRVVDASGTTVRIELESQMKVVTVDRTHISGIVNAPTTPYRYGSGSETPMHPSRTPLHPYMTPMRDSGGWFFRAYIDGACRVALGASGHCEIITASPNKIEIVPPQKSDKIKIIGGAQRGATGKLIGVDGTDGIVKVDDTLEVKNMVILAKLAHLS